MSTASRLISYDESLLLPEDKCEEIVRGEIRKMPPASLRHALFIEKLERALAKRLDSAQFAILASNFGQAIRKKPFTYRVPDLGVYNREKLSDDHYIWAPAELLVEVVSPANRKGDLVELLSDYAEIRTPEVWFAELDLRAIRQFALDGSTLREVARITEGSIDLRQLDRVSVDLRELY